MSATQATRARTHENYSSLWQTSPEWLEWVLWTIGPFFDPCPADWDGERDGLKAIWAEGTYVNHPGGKGEGGKSNADAWWRKFVAELRLKGPRARFVWCGFSAEHLWRLRPSPFDLPGWLVLPRARVHFIDARTGKRATSTPGPTWWWSSCQPAMPPVVAKIVRTA